MVENILQMLEIAKKEKEIGKYTHIALGKNNLPKSMKDGYKQIKLKLWATKRS